MTTSRSALSMRAMAAALTLGVALTPPRLLHPNGRPRYQLNFYAVNKKGDVGSASLYPSQYAANDGTASLRDTAYLYDKAT